ncbi:MAG TPA: DNA adenine methylase [Pseudonocardia sp.]|jgi:DNA adenine methylase|nr:DNA adenine methylase [Pseudonocardia sp.]
MGEPTKPPVGYFGSKVRIAPKIVATFPEHRHYVEPFAGSLAVLLAKPRSYMETVNDLDGDLMTFWRVLRDQPDELIRVCTLTVHAREELKLARSGEPCGDIERARRVWVMLTQSHTGSLLGTGWRNHVSPKATNQTMPDRVASFVSRLPAAAERLRRVTLECRPALDLISRYGSTPGVMLYVDPPYLGSTRPTVGYRHEMRDETEHRELASALGTCTVPVVLSGYDSPLYRDLYQGWQVQTLSAFTGKNGANGQRTEVLWSNDAAVQERAA